MPPEPVHPLITTAALAAELGAPHLRILDASWAFPGPSGQPEPDVKSAHQAARIPNAVFFDIDVVADHATDLPHMLPLPAVFAQAVEALGVSDADRVVVYDQGGVRSAARAWWMFRAMGHENVRVLDGGLPKWRAEGRPVESGPSKTLARPGRFEPRPAPDLVAGFEQVRQALADNAVQVADARPRGRFSGVDPEPRPGLRRGHMPGAVNTPASDLFAPDGTLLPPEVLRTVLEGAGLDLERPVLTTCGSGITAAIVALALARLGRWRTPVYDGSWAEWGGREDALVVTG